MWQLRFAIPNELSSTVFTLFPTQVGHPRRPQLDKLSAGEQLHVAQQQHLGDQRGQQLCRQQSWQWQWCCREGGGGEDELVSKAAAKVAGEKRGSEEDAAGVGFPYKGA